MNKSTALTSTSLAQFDNHPAFEQLDILRQRLSNASLSKEHIKSLFATLWPFYRETPSGALSLALRISDTWMTFDPWNANQKASIMLSVIAEDYGNASNHYATHHQLFLKTIKSFGLSAEDVQSEHYILSYGKEMANLARKYYRESSLGEGLGFNYMTEYTAQFEFSALLDGMKTHDPKHSLTFDPLLFFKIHVDVEPEHAAYSKKMIDDFLYVYPQATDEVLSGCTAYLVTYEKLFSQINTMLS